MTAAQRFAQIGGWLFVIVGAAGFVVTGASMDPHPDTAPRLLGFPLNALHNVVHLAFGIWGVVASRAHDAARVYLIVAGAIYLLLAAAGYIAPTGFGLVPLGGSDIGLHLALGAGFVLAYLATRTTASPPPR